MLKTRKTWSLSTLSTALLFAVNIALVAPSFAEEAQTKPLSGEASPSDLPTTEKAFVAAINKFDKKSIVALLGEPAKAEDVRLKGSTKVVASIWQYHNINTTEDGTYYLTTELDFIDDKVVQVVFLNNDGTEVDVPGQTYEVPPVEPTL